MKLPTRYLPAKTRSAVRFFFVGTTGAILQTWFFMAALTVMGEPDKGTVLYYIAFGIGYILEMIPNYFFSNWYTFNTKPSKKNAGGFLFARGRCDGRRKLVFRAGSPKNNFRRPMAQRD